MSFADPDGADDGGLEVVLDHPDRSIDTARLAAVLQRAADDQQVTIRYLAVILTDRATVHELNRSYLDHDYPTDVVSFPLDEQAVASGAIDGEVYVDLDTAAERAPEFGASYETEAFRYAVHGLLHLIGYDDSSDQERETMRALEDRYLS